MRDFDNKSRSSITRNSSSKTNEETCTNEHFNVSRTTLKTNTQQNNKGTDLQIVKEEKVDYQYGK